MQDGVRTITGEMVVAARRMTAGRAEVHTRPGPSPYGASDGIFITLPPGRDGRPDPGTLAALTKGLDRVARNHHLNRVTHPGPPGVVYFDYQRAGLPMLAISVATQFASPSPGGAAKLAVIVDDLGYTRGAAEKLLSLHVPLTFAVLPHLPYSTEIAEAAHGHGFQILLHLPMQPLDDARDEAIELGSGMSQAQVSTTVAAMLETVPFAVGVNNHEGSRATADPRLMNELMTTLAGRGLFFIDSRTTEATVAYSEAMRAGVPAASRSVFLDDTEIPAAVRAQLALAVRDARRNGAAIVIGHPHPVTLAVLARELPRLARQNITLVYASELCQEKGGPVTARFRPAFPRPAKLPVARSRALQ
jgi:uncharacterized protein